MALACRLPDPDALATLVRETGLELIVVHTRWLDASQKDRRSNHPFNCLRHRTGKSDVPPGDVRAWLDAAIPGRRADLRLIHRDPRGGDLLFRVERTPGADAPTP
jgi:hypothetical protein